MKHKVTNKQTKQLTKTQFTTNNTSRPSTARGNNKKAGSPPVRLGRCKYNRRWLKTTGSERRTPFITDNNIVSEFVIPAGFKIGKKNCWFLIFFYFVKIRCTMFGWQHQWCDNGRARFTTLAVSREGRCGRSPPPQLMEKEKYNGKNWRNVVVPCCGKNIGVHCYMERYEFKCQIFSSVDIYSEISIRDMSVRHGRRIMYLL